VSKQTVYVLIHYYYDYHEFQDVIHASTDRLDLLREANNTVHHVLNRVLLVEGESTHKSLSESETEHFYIKQF
jgi:hypothetical protein